MPFAGIRYSTNGHRAVFHCILTRQCRVDACALARCAGCIDSVVVIVSNLRHKLRLENAAIAYCKARRLVVSIYHRHLEAVCAASLEREVHCRVTHHMRLLGRDVLCRRNDACRPIGVGGIHRTASLSSLVVRLRVGLRRLRLLQTCYSCFQVCIYLCDRLFVRGFIPGDCLCYL